MLMLGQSFKNPLFIFDLQNFFNENIFENRLSVSFNT